jgi:hypothetical protein
VFDITYGDNERKARIVNELGDERLKNILKIDSEKEKEEELEI